VTSPYLVACLATLRAEFNALSPHRDKGADGWIGDTAHQARTSDHNPDSAGRVLALDIDSTGPWPDEFSSIVESLRGDSRLEYIIWNRRIASRGTNWSWQTYTGTSDPHTSHAHFSARHDHTGNTSTATWHLEDFMPLTEADVKAVAAEVVKALTAGTPMNGADGKPDGTSTNKIGAAALAQGIPDGLDPKGGRQTAWEVIQHLGQALARVEAKVDALQ